MALLWRYQFSQCLGDEVTILDQRFQVVLHAFSDFG